MTVLKFDRFISLTLWAVLLALPNALLAQQPSRAELANSPLSLESKAPPTIAFLVDDSTTMRVQSTPEFIRIMASNGNTAAIPNDYACTGVFNIGNSQKMCTNTGTGSADVSEYFKQPTTKAKREQRIREFFFDGQPPLLASAYNKLAYDPLVDYLPPVGYPDQTDFKNVFWSGSNFKNGAEDAWRPTLIDLESFEYDYNEKASPPDNLRKYEDIANRFLKGDTYHFQRNVLSVPSHFYRTAVRWCQSTTAKFDECKEDRDQSGKFIYPYFYSHLGDCDGNTDNKVTAPFEMVVLDYVPYHGVPTTHVYKYCDRKTKTIKEKVRTRQQELVNYANWAAYYRNRAAALRTVSSLAFNTICDADDPKSECYGLPAPRIMLDTVSRASGTTSPNQDIVKGLSIDVNDPPEFKGTTRTAFLDRLSRIRLATGVPKNLVTAVDKTAKRFSYNKSQTNVAQKNKFIKYSCQRNYIITYSDGNYADKGQPAIAYDVYIGGKLPAAVDVYGTRVYEAKNSRGQDIEWPHPINGKSVGNGKEKGGKLSDKTLLYWESDISDFSIPKFKVVPTANDPATWQHINFVALGFGLSGALPSQDQAKTLREIQAGTLKWPTMNFQEGSNTIASQYDLGRMDDLWHATVNGFGRFVNAQSPYDFKTGLQDILSEIFALSAGSSAVAYTGHNFIVDDEYIYIPSFSSDWSGDLNRRGVDQSGSQFDVNDQGSKLQSGDKAQVSAKEKLNATKWSDRKIFTAGAGGKAIAFEWNKLTSTQQSFLGSEKIVNYLRGDRGNEGSSDTALRSRQYLLGDIVNASPVVVDKPYCIEFDVDVPGQGSASGKKEHKTVCSPIESKNPGYEEFYKDNKNRKTMVYVGANDGMLHAFDGDLNEKWAYVPSVLLRAKDKQGLANLADQPLDFHHYYYVDATPRSWDVLFDDGSWHTVLVGGLGKGGAMYYALDVTDGANNTNAEKKLLWEFYNDGSAAKDYDLGYSFGQPVIGMTNATGAKWSYSRTFTNASGVAETRTFQRWVAILSSGYNNGKGTGSAAETIGVPAGDGKGRIYFVDIETGEKLAELATPEGTPDKPIELVNIEGYVENEGYQVITSVYGADNQGNLWRFDIKDDNPNHWSVEKLGVLKDKNNKTQYATTSPMIFLADDQRYVAVGTGGYRNNKELRDAKALNTFYVFKDGNKENVGTDDNINRAQMESVDYKKIDSGLKMDKKGWYVDLPEGYNFNVLPSGYGRAVVFAANKSNISSNPTDKELCSQLSRESMVMARDVSTGKSVLSDDKQSDVAMLPIDGATYSLDVMRTLSGISVAANGIIIGSIPDVPPSTGGGGSLGGLPERVNIRYIIPNM